MFRAIFSLIIRSIITEITASGFIHVCLCRLLSWMSHDSSRQQQVSETRSCNYSEDAPDYERKYCSNHVEQSMNNNLSYTVASFLSFCKNCIMMHVSMNVQMWIDMYMFCHPTKFLPVLFQFSLAIAVKVGAATFPQYHQFISHFTKLLIFSSYVCLCACVCVSYT